jgi:hypothetical protein
MLVFQIIQLLISTLTEIVILQSQHQEEAIPCFPEMQLILNQAIQEI